MKSLAAAALASALALPAGAYDWYCGSGRDGALTLSGARSENPVRAQVTGNVSAGGTVIPVSNAGLFTVGDLILVTQVLNNAGTPGDHELARVVALNTAPHQLTVSRGLAKAYGNFAAQVQRVGEYSSVSVLAGAAWDVVGWAGQTGGVFAIVSTGPIRMSGGTLSVQGRGYRGGPGGAISASGTQGESVTGNGTVNSAQNASGGGGGVVAGGFAGGGGGGGHGAAGTTGGQAGPSTGGSGGSANGAADLSRLLFGGGGGGGSGDTGLAGFGGGQGGGVVLMVSCGPIELTGGTLNAGGAGGSGGGAAGGGGGAAGGSVRLVSTGTVNLGAGVITAAGGNGGAGSVAGGPGGQGRVAVLNAASRSGTPTPTEDATSADGVTLDDPFTAPRAVTDLKVSAVIGGGLDTTSVFVRLTWTAPGADGSSTTLNGGFFTLRWANSPITSDALFDAAGSSVDIATSAVVPGSPQSRVIGPIDPNIAAYFAIKTTDTWGMTSALSNPATAAARQTALAVTAQNTYDVAWADFDQDGDLDAFSANRAGENAQRLTQTAGEFAAAGVFSGTDGTGLAWGDYDKDGDQDLLVANGFAGTAESKLLVNLGGGSFLSQSLPGAFAQSLGAAWADLDNDGDLDAVLANDGGRIRALRNDGGAFAEFALTGSNERNIAVVAGDFDADGRTDLAVATENGVLSDDYVLYNDGGFAFTKSLLTGANSFGRGVAAGDFDGDGDLDLVFAYTGGSNEMVFLNNGNRSFAFPASYATGGNSERVQTGDYDNDGDVDAVVTNIEGTHNKLLKNTGSGSFAVFDLPKGAGVRSRGVSFGDYDADGDLDLLVGNDLAEPEYLVRNDTGTPNAAPVPPGPEDHAVLFSYAKTGSTLTFAWKAGSFDGGAATASLHYDLAVSTYPLDLTAGATGFLPSVNSFVVPPSHHVPGSGNRARPGYKDWTGEGFPFHAVQISSRGAPTGSPLQWNSTYYLRVQTIDAGLARSTWGAQKQFYLPDPCAKNYSKVSGSWSDPGTWVTGLVPYSCTPVEVQAGHAVTVDISSAAASTTTVYGTLAFSRTQASSLTLAGGDLVVGPGGALDMGTAASPIPAGVRAALVLASGTTAGHYGLNVELGGRFFARGAAKNPWGYATASVPSGALGLTLSAADAALWQVGDEIVIGPTDGAGLAAAERRVLTSVSGGDPVTLGWAGGLAGNRILTPETPIPVGNLTRNVLIRSSGTVLSGPGANSAYALIRSTGPADAVLSFAEFAFLGANVPNRRALQVLGGALPARAEVSSCAVRDGYAGVELQSAAAVKLERNVIAGNALSGLASYSQSDGARVTRNLLVGNSAYGADVDAAPNGLLHGNVVAANASGGFRNAQSSGTAYSSNTVHGNGGVGLFVTGFQSVGVSIQGDHLRHNLERGLYFNNNADRAVVDRVRSSSNTQRGLHIDFNVARTRVSRSTFSNNTNGGLLSDGTLTTLLGNAAFLNGSYGFSVENDSQTVVGNRSFSNTGGAKGFWVTNGSHTFIDNHAWGNAGPGVFVQQASSVVWAGGAVGFRPDGAASPNAGGELLYDSASSLAMNMELRGVRADLGALDVSAMKAGNSLSAYQLSYDTGTLRVWGDYAVANRGFRLDYSSRSWAAGHSLPVVMGGANAHLAAVAPTVAAVSQLVTIEHRGGQWHVDGSVSGPDLLTFTGSISGLAVPGATPQFLLTFTQAGVPAEGDRLEFALVAGSDDADRPKGLLVGPAAPAFNAGKSRIGVAAGAAFELRGAPGFPTRLDRLSAGSTYFTFVGSGAFVAVNSSVSNTDSKGLQFHTNSVVLASTTFDFMGVAEATGTYVTLHGGLGAAATFYGLAFANSRSTAAAARAYNIRLLGAGPHLTTTLRKWSGAMGGETYEGDLPQNELRWSPFRPDAVVPGITAVSTFSITAQWAQGANDAGVVYEVQVNTYNFANGSIASSYPVTGLSAPVAGLLPNTSYFVRVFASEPGTDEFSPELQLGATATLATPPTPAALPFLGVFETSAAVAWAAHPSAPLSSSTYGYALEASSTNFNGAGLVYSSVTNNVLLSTLTVGGPGGLLERNTTYYFRVGSRNWFGAPNFTALGASVTLTNPVAGAIAGVFVTSVTATWPPRPAAPQEATAEGYALEASSTDFGALGPGGVLYSSRTAAVSADRLTIPGLTPYVTYYFRVGTLNWAGAANYAVLGATVPTAFKRAPMPATGGSSYGAAWADYDKDGDLDAVVTNAGVEDEYLLRNDGSGVLTRVVLPLSGGDSRGVAWADFDNDGDLDALVANAGGENEAVLVNNGGGSFTKLTLLTAGNSVGVAWGDYDNDGDLDALVANAGTEDEFLLRNDGGTLTKIVLTGTAGDSRGVAWGDYDNDGDLDALVANDSGQDEVLLRNDGGTLVKVPLPGTIGASQGVAWSDYDGDGDLDAIVANAGTEAEYLLRNDGGTLVKVALPGTGGASTGVSWGDYDGDGDLDALVANSSGQDEALLRNDGGGVLTMVALTGTGGGSESVSWGDFDNDGDLDVLVANYGSGEDEVLLRNDAVVAQSSPLPPSSGFNAAFQEFAPFSSSGTLTLSWGNGSDVQTSTSALDYFVRVGTTVPGSSSTYKVPDRYSLDGRSGGGSSFYSTRLGAGQRGLKLALNKEATAYWAVTTQDSGFARSAESSEQSTGLAAPRAVTDLRVAAQVSTGLGASTMSITLAWTAPGADGTSGALSGVYDLRWSSKTPLTSTSAYVAAQYSVKIVTAGVTPGASVYYTFPDLDTAATWYFALSTLDSQTYPQGVRSGLSNPVTAPSYVQPVAGTGGQSYGPVWADYDGDGDLDALVPNAAAQDEVVLRNDGGGIMTKIVLTGTAGDSTGAAWGDYDNDGDLDALVANANGQDEVLLRNDGGGTLTKLTVAGSGGDSHAVAWGDYDNDGDLDALVANAGVENEVLLRNDGGGVLVSVVLAGTGGNSFDAAWGDYDGDGDLDALVANIGVEDEVLLRNDGGGALTKAPLAGTAGSSYGVAWADHDKDGDLDALIANIGGEDEVLLRNDGGGTLTKVTLTGTAGDSYGVAWGDYDNDGDLDAMLANHGTEDERLLRNEGAGIFTSLTLKGTGGDANGAAAADFDGDGDLDAVVSNSSSQDEVLLRNDVQAPNADPIAPSPSLANLSFEYDESGATLTVRWDPGSDGGADTDTLTYQLAMATAPMTLLAPDGKRIAAPAKFAVPWAFGSPSFGSYPRPAFRVWPGTLVPQHGRQLRVAKTGGTLVNDATYYIRLQAVDAGLARSAWSVELSTFVFAAIPAGGRAVSSHLSSMTVTYSTVAGGTAYFAEAFSDAGYATLVSSAGTTDLARTSGAVSGLAFNTTYYLRLGTLYSRTTAYAAAAPAAAVTLATRPALAAQTFSDVGIASMSVAWASGGNPPGTRYDVEASTYSPSPGAGGVSTAPTGALAATLTGLSANTTYYLGVTAYNHAGTASPATALGSTVTRIETPTGVYFESVSTGAIVAAATNAAGGFTNLAVGTSATSVALFGVYSDWRVAATSTVFSGLTPNAAYTFKARARNQHGAVSGETAEISTYTLAAPPLSAGTTFLAVFASSVQFQWAAGGNPGGTEYRVGASTAADYNAAASSRASAWFAGTSTSVVSLSPSTTWFFRVQARNGNNVETIYTVLGSTFTPLFSAVPLAGTGGDSYGARWGDFDADGDLDLLAANFAAGASAVLRNDGGEAFTKLLIPGAPAALDAAWGDFDGDGDLDIAFANYSGDEAVARYDGGTVFTMITLTGTGGASRGAAWGDFDGDGDLDLAVANDSGQDEVVARNDGSGGFAVLPLAGSGGNSRGVYWGDANGDGHLDLMIVNDGANLVLAVNTGAGTFNLSSIPGTSGSQMRGAWADYDGDGDRDFLIARSGGPALLVNDGAGAFSILASTGPAGTDLDVSWGDFDVDGDLDAVLGGASALSVLRNEGGTFMRLDVSHPLADLRAARWGDFDGDGDLDLGLASRGGAADEALMRNEAQPANPAPSAPSADILTLESGVSGATLTVRWDPATDGGGATAALNYALVVATSPMTLSGDSLRVVSPSSFVVAWNQGLQMGDRQRPAFKVWPGGAGAQHGIPFKLDAPNVLTANFKSDATYYIRLQAIDAGLKRGPWGAEVSTYVFRAEPPAGRSVTGFGVNALTVAYSTVGASAYLLEGSTAPDFSGTLLRSSTTDLSLASLSLAGLAANTTHHLRMGSLWRRTTGYAAAVPAAAVTRAADPVAAAVTWAEVRESSAVAAWLRNGNPVDVTTYTVVASTGAAYPNSFPGNRALSTAPAGALPQGELTGLAPNTTHYLHVAAVNHVGTASAFTALGATVTRIETPSAVVFDSVSSTTLLARATAVPSGFTNLGVGTSAVNIALNGVSQGWVVGSSVAASTGLTPNTLYTFRARSRNLLGVESGESPAVSTYTLAAVPGPAAAGFTGLGVSSISLQWQANGNPPGTEYLAGVSTDPAFGAGTVRDSGYTTAVSTSLLGLVPNSTYYAAALARNASGIETAVLSLGATVTYAAPPGSAVSTWTAVSSNALTAAWDAGGNPAGTRYTASLSTSPLPNGDSGNVLVTTAPGGAPAAGFAGLTPNTTYYLAARGLSHAGVLTDAAVLGSTVTRAAPPAAAPTTFIGVHVSSFEFVWQRNGNPVGVTTYAVAATTANFYPNAFMGTVAFSTLPAGGTPMAFFAGLAPNTTWSVFVQAYDHAGTGTGWQLLGSTPTRPSAPTAGPLTAVSVTSAVAHWAGGANPPGTRYEVTASTGAAPPNGFSGDVAASTEPFGVLAATMTGLAANTTVYFHVRALGRDGTPTAWAALGSTATLAGAPGAAAATFTAVGQTSMTLSWTAGLNPPGTLYWARASTSTNLDGAGDLLLGLLSGLTTGFTGLTADTTYYFRVAARGHGGQDSSPHDPGAKATLAFAPTASTAPFHSVGVSSATLQWQGAGNPPGTLYRADASTAADFSGSAADSGWAAFLSTTVTGLVGDSTYYWRVRARNVAGVETAYLSLGSTPTAAADPLAASFASVGPASIRAEWWAGGNREADATGAWATRTALPTARERHAAAQVGGRVYVVGGLVAGAASAEVWSAAMTRAGLVGAWRREADLPAPRESHALAAYAGRLYVLGGFDGSAKATVYSADLSTAGAVAGWRTESGLPAARFKLAAVAHGGWLYALGGDNGVVSQATVYRAPIASEGRVGSWGTATALPAARNSHAAAVSGGRLYVSGGLGAGVEEEVWSAPLAGASVGPWSVQTPLPVPVFRHAMTAGGGALVVVGGHDGNAALTQVLSAPLAAAGAVGGWAPLGALPLARFGHGAVVETSNLFVVGGADDATAAADVLQAALGGTEYNLEWAENSIFTVAYGSSNWRPGAGAEVPGFTPNRTYHLRVRSRARSGLEGSAVVFGSTLTPAAAPGGAASTFSLVEAGSMTLTWTSGGNPPGTEFLAGVSTSSDFTSVLTTAWTTAVSSAIHGLSPNTTYFAVVLARDSAGRETREASLGSTVTAAAVPTSPFFPSVATTGLTVQWSTAANPAQTRYEAELSAAPSFSPLAASSVTLSSGAQFGNLLSAATYYLRVRAFNRLGTPSAYSVAVQTVTGADFSAPAAVTGLGLHASETPGVLLAAWTAPGDDGSAGVLPAGSRYYLQWAAGDPASVSWSTAAAQLAPSTGPVTPGAESGILVTGVSVGASVYARVWTADESGNVSAPSATAAVWASPFTLARLDGSSQDAGRWVSAAVDRAGDAHAAYTAGTISQELRYLKRAGGVWSVAEAPDPGIQAEEVVLAVGHDVPQAVYRNSSTGQLRHARRSAGWVTGAVASGDLHPGGLAVDATGLAHVSYYDAGLPGLRYARGDGASWTLSTVDPGAGLGRHSSLALGADSTPHIAYYDAANGDLKYASRTAAGAWLTSTVDPAAVDVGSSPVLALDGDGNASVFYLDAAAKDLKWARFDGAAWTLGKVDSTRAVTAVRGAALDGAGRAAVAYYDGTDGDLHLARFNGTAWDLGAVDSRGDVGAWAALTVEADGGLLVLHYDAGAGDLRSASWAAGLTAPLAGNPRGRAQAPSSLGAVVASSTTIQWTWTDSAAGELGWRLYGGSSSTGPFSVVAGTTALPASAGTGTQRVYTETGLVEGTTYFRYVAAVSSGGFVVSPTTAAYPYSTADLTAPTVNNLASGGDMVWRRAVGTLYNVDFGDAGGSALSKFQVKASTVALGAGPDLVAYTDVVVGILADSYTADWALPSAFFTALRNAATNYVSIRVVDGNGNAATVTDAFKVLKDTAPPTLADDQGDDPVRRAAGGTAYDVNAFDAGSGLERFQYSVSTAAGSADGGAVGWTDVALPGGATFYQTDWTLAFAGLIGDATNYVSVRAWDRAGSTASLTDAFSVVKDTAGPRVAVLQPAAAVRSVLTVVSGTAADAAGVGGVQVAIQETPPGGFWYDGAGITSVTPVWLTASGTTSWTFTGVPAWADGASYRVVARASDTLGNFSVVYATADFSLDASTPTAVVTVPVSGSTISVLAALSGTAADGGPSPSGLSLIEVRLQRAADGLYWNWLADAWGSVSVATTPAVASPWTVPVMPALAANLAHGSSYFVSVRAADNAVPANTSSGVAGSTFAWSDTTPPAAITDLTALTGEAPGDLALAWTAPGDDGAAGETAFGQYRVHYSTDPGASFSTSAAQVAFSTANVKPGARHGRLITGLSAGTTYHVRVFFSDDAGNWSALSSGATAFAGVQPFQKITGHVMKASSEGITAVLLEAYDANDLVVSSTFSLADGSGSYSLGGVVNGVFRIQATYTVGDVASSVWLDNVAVGSFNVDFVLEINYTLSKLTGTLASLSAQAAAPHGFLTRAAEGNFSDAKVELLRGGVTVAAVRPDPAGRWSIGNLLPGKYAVRAFNGLDFTEPQPVELGEGETQEVVFVFDPLPEASVFAFPNPARSKTTFRFVSALPGLEAQVTVFDIAGTLVKELPGSAFVPKGGGVYHADWDLTNDDGESVASGVYLFMVKVKGSNGQSGKVIKKLAVVR